MTFKPIILLHGSIEAVTLRCEHGSIEAEAVRCENDAVISEVKVVALPALMNMTGWRDGNVAMLVMQWLVLAYEIAAGARELGGRRKGNKLTAPPEAFAHLRREVYALTRDIRVVALVDHAFLKGWKRNKRGGPTTDGKPNKGGAPKKTAAATVMELMKRTGKMEEDKRALLRSRTELMERRGRTEEDKQARISLRAEVEALGKTEKKDKREQKRSLVRLKQMVAAGKNLSVRQTGK